MTVSSQHVATSEATAVAPALFSARYRRYALGLLLAVYIVNFTDRQVLAILMEPIKHELQISDSALGFLSGAAFAIFYATLGIPIGRLADRASRRTIIAVCLALWSGMTALSGLVGNFWQLVGARIGVAVGEAGGSPPAHSLISDYFPPAERGRALAIYSLGIPIGILVGFLIGGWVNEWIGWRAAFFVVGLPGPVLAVILRLTLREPPRGLSEPPALAASVPDGPPPTVRDVVGHMWRHHAFRHLSYATAIFAFAAYGVIQWLPSYLIRSFGLSAGQTATGLALILGVVGGIGMFSGGWLADRLGRRDRRWYVWVPAIGMLISGPASVFVYLAADATSALLFLILPMFLSNMWAGPTLSMVQGLSPLRMRATASAVIFFVISIVGLGGGPQAVGLLSDALRGTAGADSVRYALLIVSAAYVWAGLHYLIAGRHLRAGLAAVTP